MSTARYERLKNVGKRDYNEKSDCGVIALAVAKDVSYGKAQACLTRAGRKPRTSTSIEQFRDAAAALGIELTVQTGWTGKTMKTIPRELDNGTYLCFTRGHVAAVVDGVVHDWTQGRRHRVLAVLKVGSIEPINLNEEV